MGNQLRYALRNLENIQTLPGDIIILYPGAKGFKAQSKQIDTTNKILILVIDIEAERQWRTKWIQKNHDS